MTSEFWQTWGDAQDEIAGYSLTMPAEGQLRKGTCVVITGIRPFSKSLRIEVDESRHSKADVARAAKINVLREYSIGARVCRDMKTSYAWLDAFERTVEGAPAKISFSSQSWDGQSWLQMIWSPGRITQVSHGYRDGEGDRQRSFVVEPDSTAEDLLLLTARRIAWPRLRLGQTYAAPVLTSTEAERAKAGIRWAKVEMSLGKDRETVVVPGGRFRTYPFRAKWPDGFTRQFDVEADAPNRVVRWTSGAGERAELTGVLRIKPSQVSAENADKVFEALGLKRFGTQ